jgi:hypothetical protein
MCRAILVPIGVKSRKNHENREGESGPWSLEGGDRRGFGLQLLG